jgi:hypothetical protein
MRVWLLAAAFLVAGCGHGDRGGTVLLHAPFIENLAITVLTPLVEGQRGVYEFRAEFADPDGDLDGGSCQIDTSIGPAQLPLAVSRGTDPGATFGTIVCLFETTVRGRVVSGTFTITDRNGLTSNGINFTVPAARVHVSAGVR